MTFKIFECSTGPRGDVNHVSAVLTIHQWRGTTSCPSFIRTPTEILIWELKLAYLLMSFIYFLPPISRYVYQHERPSRDNSRHTKKRTSPKREKIHSQKRVDYSKKKKRKNLHFKSVEIFSHSGGNLRCHSQKWTTPWRATTITRKSWVFKELKKKKENKPRQFSKKIKKNCFNRNDKNLLSKSFQENSQVLIRKISSVIRCRNARPRIVSNLHYLDYNKQNTDSKKKLLFFKIAFY